MQREFRQANENAMLMHKEQEGKKKKERSKEFRPDPTCMKCGELLASRHWKCPNVHPHYLGAETLPGIKALFVSDQGSWVDRPRKD